MKTRSATSEFYSNTCNRNYQDEVVSSMWKKLDVTKVSETFHKVLTACSGGDLHSLGDFMKNDKESDRREASSPNNRNNKNKRSTKFAVDETREPVIAEDRGVPKDKWQDKELIFQRPPKIPGLISSTLSNESHATNSYLKDHEESGVKLRHTPLNSKSFESEARRQVHDRVSTILEEYVDIEPCPEDEEEEDSTTTTGSVSYEQHRTPNGLTTTRIISDPGE